MSTENAAVLPFPRSEGPAAPVHRRKRVRLEVTPRGRRVLVAVAFLLGLLIASAVLLLTDVPSALAGEEGGEPVTVTVAAGDTLWGYAQQHAPEGMSEQEYVTEVRSLNHLPTARITAGEEIELPAL